MWDFQPYSFSPTNRCPNQYFPICDNQKISPHIFRLLQLGIHPVCRHKPQHYYGCHVVLEDRSLAWLSSERLYQQLTETIAYNYSQPLNLGQRPICKCCKLDSVGPSTLRRIRARSQRKVTNRHEHKGVLYLNVIPQN